MVAPTYLVGDPKNPGKCPVSQGVGGFQHYEVFCRELQCKYCGQLYLESHCMCGGVYIFHDDCQKRKSQEPGRAEAKRRPWHTDPKERFF